MKDQNLNNEENLNDTELPEEKRLNSTDGTAIGILAIFVLVAILLIFQLISYISNIDFLAPFPGFNFIIIPICIVITFMAIYILNRLNYMVIISIHINKLISCVEKYPLIYKILRFIHKHPIISTFVMGIIWAST